MYKRTTAPWAGQKSEKQPKSKDKFIHEARWAVKNITTALAAVGSFFFHNAPKVANKELSINTMYGAGYQFPRQSNMPAIHG